MNFFARQEQSRRTSRVLVLVFLLAFCVVALATTVVVAAALRLYMENNTLFLGTQTWREWLAGHGGLVAIIAGGTLALMAFASLFRAATLARGGGQVARMLGATEVSGEGNDPLQRRLVNVVEEMALAAGLPVPEVFVLEKEAGINAFAAGLTSADAAITVTRGALERLDRNELQGVIAHEFSHIVNGDMRLNQQLIGLSFGILVLSLAGRWLLRGARYAGHGRGRNGGQAAALAIGLALTIIGAIGVLLSRLIKAAVARQRERLADASAVQFTREPEGLAGALKKIAGYSARLTSVESEEVAHMLFERGARSFTGWFATHPPLLERIRALEPGFDPRELRAPVEPPQPVVAAHADVAAASHSLAPAATGAVLLEQAGRIDAPAVGGALRDALPSEIYHATRSRDSSPLLVLALALAPHEATRRRQLGLIEQQLGTTRAGLCTRLFAELESVERRLRLPILELAIPALKQRPSEQLAYLFELLTRLDELDDEPRLFDFVLLRVLAAYLRGVPGAVPAVARPRTPHLDTPAAVRALLGAVAAFGHDDTVRARAAYAAGLAALGGQAETADAAAFAPSATTRDLRSLDAALAALRPLRPRAKERLLRGVLATIQADATIATEERELFRLIATTLDCPLPPGQGL